jgi:antitoxin component YwqK of YwqJK toxin-antitoxin module
VTETEHPVIVTQDDPNLSGEFIEKYPNGNVKTEGWNNKEGNRDKTWYSYYENGVKWSESNYINGLKEGASKVYFENGKIRYSGFYTADKKSGHWIFYNEAGGIEKEENH